MLWWIIPAGLAFLGGAAICSGNKEQPKAQTRRATRSTKSRPQSRNAHKSTNTRNTKAPFYWYYCKRCGSQIWRNKPFNRKYYTMKYCPRCKKLEYFR